MVSTVSIQFFVTRRYAQNTRYFATLKAAGIIMERFFDILHWRVLLF
jgi:hypothetical protein